jgi:BA14K-like protein
MQSLKVSAVMVALVSGVAMFSVGSASAMPLGGAALDSASKAAGRSLIIDVQVRRYRGYRGGRFVRRRGDAAAAIIGGVIIGGIIASQVARPYYYYDNAISYCMNRFRSYDPYSRTYLGYDGYRHPCP